MSTLTFSENKLEEILNAAQGIVCRKKAIVAVLVNDTKENWTYDTILESGKKEVSNVTVPPGFALTIQPQGEMNVLMVKGKSTFEKLYDTEYSMGYGRAVSAAAERKLTITSPEFVAVATRSIRGKTNPNKVRYYVAQGVCKPFRVVINLPKPGWGEGQFQVAELDSVIVLNLIVGDTYYIGKAEFLANWFIDVDGKRQLEGQEMWDQLPVLSPESWAEIVGE